MGVSTPVVIGLLTIIAAVDIAQFGYVIRHERRLTRIEDARSQDAD